MPKIILYQTLPRLFGNDCTDGVPDGTLQRNGCGKFNDYTKETLQDIRDMGVTHVWYTGVIAHASATAYPEAGIAAAPAAVLKGKAGSPYAIRDYYDVDPDLAVDVTARMREFEALVARTHRAGMRVIIDFVPNHVARVYHSDARPAGVEDLGASDRTGLAFHPANNFYYIPDQPFVSPASADGTPYREWPARATGNDCFTATPSANDWYETVKLNYGVDYLHGGQTAFDPIPDTWFKMRDILRFWASKQIDGFRCDMAEMVPVAFWHWAVSSLKSEFPGLIFIGEVYQPALYRTYISEGGFDYLYDKVGLYDILRGVMTGSRPASDITRAWQAVEGIQDRMLSFLENHDEQRIASDFFAGSPLPGRPALAVAALMRGNPFMLYAGQEFGEEGMQQEGFSGRDGRTSIFDYAALPCLQAWRHRKEPGAPRLQDDQLALRAFYRTVLQVAATDRTAVEGQFYDLMYAAPDGFDRSRQYAFLRYVDEELMVVVANFAENDVEVPVQIPAHAFEFLRMETDLTVACTDLIGGDIRRFTFSPDYPFRVPVPGFSAVAYRCTLHRTPPDCTLPREAGTAVPVFSLRSAHDAGIGDFADLRLLVDWATDTGQRWIQVLPVNDTTRTHSWHDSYPYNAISAFALHPLYIRLEDIGPLPAADKAGLPEPPASQEGGLDYDAVDNYKWKIFKLLYKRDGRRTLASADFRRFFEPRRFWLEPYAAFSLLRDRYGTADFRQWPAYAVYDAAAVRQLLDDGADEAGLYYFLQYHAAKQLQAVHDYARHRGVSLKGDIPIGVSRDGADIWSLPGLFDDTMSAGAPPDDFSDDGQNWGFPLYRWDVMAADGYQWWRQRLQTMAAYFDAYRLDHILGFFRIFAIPRTARSGLLGYFRPARPLQPADMRKWGIVFDRNRCTLPWLDEAWLHERFAPDELAFVRKVFLQAVGDGVFTLRPAYRTQAAVAARCAADRSGIFEGRPQLQSRIEALCCEVLLIHDTQAGGYHPRISCWKSRSFQALSPEEQRRFMAMYHDYFYVRHTAFWKAEAMRKLPALCAAADMLVCGEDLGMIPDSVPEVLRELHILSLEIFRMPKVPGIPFGILKNNPYESVCTTSSHDTSTLRGWWEEQHDDACRYYHEVLRLDGDVPYFCEPWLCERILAAHLQSPSRLAIFPLQDWLAVDGEVRAQDARAERINVPADTRHYWRYRMHLTLERLLGETALNDRIRRLVQLRQFPL